MDIALIIHELLVEGGGERQVVCLAQALVQRAHRVTLYTSAYDRANCFPELCKNLEIVDVGRGSLHWMKRPFFIRGYLDMMRLARSIHQGHEIWNPHHWPAQWAALRLRSKLGGKIVWMCNDVPDFYQKASSPGSMRQMFLAPLYWLYFICDRRQNSQIDRTVLLSNWAMREYKAIYSGRTCIAQSGADPSRFAPGGNREAIRARYGYSQEDFVLLWLGIFMPHRRLEDAIQAVARASAQGVNVKLHLAGSDRSYPKYVRALKQLVAARGLQDRVRFTGKVADEEIRDFYAACDAFLFPNDKQTWGLVVLEAMACGCLCIVSRGAGVHEVLSDGENAILFTPRDAKELAEKIALAAESPGLRGQIAVAGMNLAREVYTYDRYAEQVENICAEITCKDQDARSMLPTAV